MEKNAKDIRLQHINAKRNSEKTVTRKNNYLIPVFIFLFCISGAAADSLWDPEFSGYITVSSTARIGDTVLIRIDSSLKMKFDSASQDSKSLTLEFSGGEYGKIMDFMPEGLSKGSRTLSSDEQLSLETTVTGRVMRADDNGFLFVEGVRSLAAEGKEQSLRVSGWVHPDDLGSSREINFSRLADSRLTFQSIMQPGREIISAADIEEIIRGTAAEEGEEGETVLLPPDYELSQEKKLELFLLYLNQLIDIVFRQIR